MLKSSKVVRADVCVVGIGEWGAGGSREQGHPLLLNADLRPVPSPPPACLTIPTGQGSWGVGTWPGLAWGMLLGTPAQ